MLRWNGLATVTVWFLYTVQRLRNENKVEKRTAFVKSKPCVFSHELCGYSCEYTVFFLGYIIFVFVYNVQLGLFRFEHKVDVLSRYLSSLRDFLALSKIRQRIFYNEILKQNMSEPFYVRRF